MYYNGLMEAVSLSFGILPGAFHPPTSAHLALADAALSVVQQVIFVLPRRQPHKEYSGVSFENRLELLRAATSHNPRFHVRPTVAGLLIDIARELRANLPPGAELHFLCGRDAAERIVNWDYGTPNAFENMLKEFSILVAPRAGDYAVPESLRHGIATLPIAPEYRTASATDVRERIREGREWRHLVPSAIHDRVHRLYGTGGPNQQR